VPGPVFEAGQHADELIAEAQREAERIRREAAASAQQVVGEEATRLIDLLERTRGDWHQQAEPELIALATAIAERILRRELELNPAAVAELVAAALLKANAEPILTVRVHPDDRDTVANFEAELNALAGELRIEVDERVTRHGCFVETATGTIDGTIEGQLALLRRILQRKAGAS
jgi:flagellar biosynthesis/type III secretory pathway protein FliH